ncbi:MAG TPA: response regulator [Pirellulales bacterium]|jgi:CheY-like chemotaxis protein
MAALAKMRILVVEDHADTAASLSLLLSHAGATVEVSANGKDCLSLVDEFRPDVILLDLGLPGMSGLEVAREVRCIRHSPLLVALTGFAHQQYRDEAGAAGIEHFLVKPCAIDDLLAVLGGLKNCA